MGFFEKVTVNEVGDAEVTVPMAPLLNVTEFSLAVALKPNPLMTTVPELAGRFAVASVTTGVTVATFTGAPLSTPFVVTTAFRSSEVVGLVESVTVRDVAVAAVTAPIAPLSKVTELFAAVLSNPKPSMVIVVASAAKSFVLIVTTGAKKPTVTADPLVTLLVVTIAVSAPAAFGPLVSETVSEFAVELVTLPVTPLLNTTVLLLATASNPSPLIVSVVASAANR